MGKELGCGGMALDILRTYVGSYDLKNALKLGNPHCPMGET
jgi:hypothetical protein